MVVHVGDEGGDQGVVIGDLMILLKEFLKEIVKQGLKYDASIDEMLNLAKQFFRDEFRKVKTDLVSQRESLSSDISAIQQSMKSLSLAENSEKQKILDDMKQSSEALLAALEKAASLSSQPSSTPTSTASISDSELRRIIGESVQSYSKFFVNSLAPLKPVWMYLAETWPKQNKPRILEHMVKHLSQSQPKSAHTDSSHLHSQGGEKSGDEGDKPEGKGSPMKTQRPPSPVRPLKGVHIGTNLPPPFPPLPLSLCPLNI